MPNDDVQLARNEKLETLTCSERIDCLVALLSQKNILAISAQEYAGAVDKYYNELQRAKNARKEQREKDFVTTTTKLQANIKNVVVGIMLVTILAALVSLALLAIFKPTLDPSIMPLHSGTLLTFLGFIVALAAYLATVARALKDKITALKEKTNFDAEQIAKHAENLMRIIKAEALLVWIGVMTMGRILVGPLMDVKVLDFDYFLLVYMVFTILYLGYLHAKQWTYQSMI